LRFLSFRYLYDEKWAGNRIKEKWKIYQHHNDPLHWTAAIGDHIATKEMVLTLVPAKSR
jgi:hypothetical protein